MRAELTKLENKLLERLVKDFETKVAKSKKLNDEHQLILALAQKTLLSESDVKKLKLLLEFEQSKITARENKKKAKQALQLHESEKKEMIDNRYRRFGLVMIESLKKLPNQKATILLSDFLQMMLVDEIFNKTDKEWLSNFLVESVEIVKPVEQFQRENFDESNGTMSNSVISVLPTNDNLL